MLKRKIIQLTGITCNIGHENDFEKTDVEAFLDIDGDQQELGLKFSGIQIYIPIADLAVCCRELGIDLAVKQEYG